MSILRPVDFLPTRVACHSDALVKVLLLLIQLHAVAFQYHLQELYCSSLEGEHQDHVRYALFLELIS